MSFVIILIFEIRLDNSFCSILIRSVACPTRCSALETAWLTASSADITNTEAIILKISGGVIVGTISVVISAAFLAAVLASSFAASTIVEIAHSKFNSKSVPNNCSAGPNTNPLLSGCSGSLDNAVSDTDANLSLLSPILCWSVKDSHVNLLFTKLSTVTLIFSPPTVVAIFTTVSLIAPNVVFSVSSCWSVSIEFAIARKTTDHFFQFFQSKPPPA